MPLNVFGVNAAAELFPFRGQGIVTPPPPAPVARQLIGMAITGNGSTGTYIQTAQEQHIATRLGWENNGPPVQRLYRQSQSASGGFPDLVRVISQGRIAWTSHKPGPNGIGADASGANDAHWIAWGNYYRQFRPSAGSPHKVNIWFTYDHENDRHTYSGGSDVGSPGWVARQADFVTAFRRIIDLMRSADPIHGLDHVEFGPVWTGYGFRSDANRDPALSFHPDWDFFASDPYCHWLKSDGVVNLTGRRDLWVQSSTGSGARQSYLWATDPLAWYAEAHPSWPIPSNITSNLDKFPFRFGISEAGTSFDMRPNGTNTAFIPQEDPDSSTSYMARWMTQLGADLRNRMPRCEVFIYWHDAVTGIGTTARPYYFVGPAANRWGAEWNGPITTLRTECARPEHRGTLTPWTPGGLAP